METTIVFMVKDSRKNRQKKILLDKRQQNKGHRSKDIVTKVSRIKDIRQNAVGQRTLGQKTVSHRTLGQMTLGQKTL